MKKSLIILGLGIISLGVTSCRESDLTPTLAQDKELASVISETDLRAFLNGMYSKMRDYNYLGRDYQIYGEVRSDNTFANGRSNRFITEASLIYTPDNGNMPATWYRIYEVIGRANYVINRGYSSFTGDEATIKHYVGQAYIARAMGHFDLTRIFGQHYVGTGGMGALAVPYLKHYKGDPNNEFPARNTVQQVYDEAKRDIEEAIRLMDESKDSSTRNFISSATAWALLSRMATYFGDYATAETASKKVIDSGRYSIISSADFVSSWTKKSGVSNWIFALYSNTASESIGTNALAPIYRVSPTGGGYGDISGLGNLYDIYDAGDIRISPQMATSKTGDGDGEFTNLGKFPDTQTGGDAIPVFRYEEIVLNYAEALLKNGNATEALVWLNRVPQNRNASTYSVATMDNILKERRKEFAFEGMRFHDLVRTKQGIPLIDGVKQRIGKEAIPYGSPKLAFPIPRTEMNVNSNFKQNEGY